uniref:WLM domain-containing protein n=1 Tax=Ananas comosus var. bracteatus TaxID=296719 RepID=A0A6V7Q9Q5_ANACO|nr:unnamed protein product [Ananas comosus var. bracteatus]
MTEMAPVGYVGISPKCLLGFNKNQGEEISLRLRTDDLKGFRKYESIKKTLLHELAHMVYSEHDADFFALDKQVCRRTGDPNKLMFCKRCDGAYHCYCQQPPHKNISRGPYLCPKHTKCHSCRSNVLEVVPALP